MATLPTLALVERSFDIERINAILNHPSVRPDVADQTAVTLDATAAVQDHRNYLILGEHGGCLNFFVLPGVYEVHTFVLPEGRGAWALAAASEIAHYMFTKTDAYDIYTRIPRPHIAAKQLALSIAGARFEFTPDMPCKFREKDVECDIFSARIHDWMTTAPRLEQIGEWFHEQLEATGKEIPHANLPNHNRYVGGALAMAMGGQYDKARLLFNRWAMAVHAPPVEIESYDPPIFKFNHNERAKINPDSLEFLPCAA